LPEARPGGSKEVSVKRTPDTIAKFKELIANTRVQFVMLNLFQHL
jgi:hypothetical protein